MLIGAVLACSVLILLKDVKAVPQEMQGDCVVTSK